jgi:predicted transcriptional regulator
MVDYNEFPPVFAPGSSGSDYSPVFYANAERTGYNAATRFDYEGLGDAIFGDLNGDGRLDMVCGNDFHGGLIDSRIFWGTDNEERWTDDEATDLNIGRVSDLDFGDYNGDGQVDIAMAVYLGPELGSAIYLNQGNGSFTYQPSITFGASYYYFATSGDLNNDGYDDVLFRGMPNYYLYYSGPNGPDTTVDQTFTASFPSWEPIIEDIDDDGYLDIILPYQSVGKIQIFLGSRSGPDTVADIELSFDSLIGAIGTGDINNDGFSDLVCANSETGTGSSKIRIFKGSASGWSDSDVHDLNITDYGEALKVIDIDLDGYDDIVLADAYNFKVFFGGNQWPTSAGITRPGVVDTWRLAVAVPHKLFSPSTAGRFVTEDITLPTGKRWDLVHVEGSVPSNTSVRIAVLSDTGTLIAANRTDMDIDLTPINPDVYGTIKLKVFLDTQSGNTTPTIDSILVNWMDKNEWRDQFYGSAKVDRVLELGVADGRLWADTDGTWGPQLIIPSLRDEMTYNPMSFAFLDGGGLDYTASSPMGFQTTGVMAASVADVNSDGHLDVAFATYANGQFDFITKSPVFLGSPVGWMDLPARSFNTTGARDVLLDDLDDDGHVDIVFAQEQDGNTYAVDSLLFWGSSGGWAEKPDVRFKTKGASGVVTEDLDGDGDLDLAFACYKGSTTDTDSMVFLQGPDGFDGTTADHLMATRGARAVAAGDLNGDDLPDLVFANSLSGSAGVTGSFVYMAKMGGGFEATPIGLATKGSQDVEVADLDDDGHSDIVFADYVDDSGIRLNTSPIFLNDGTGGFPSSPSRNLATMGAVAVEVVDLDGTGWMDIVFACHFNGTSYSQASLGYLGGVSGWPSTPDIQIPTVGATDVIAAYLFDPGDCGYMSQSITPRDRDGTGSWQTLRYSATLEGTVSGNLHIVDAVTWERLASAPLAAGTNEWDISKQVYFKAHPSVRIVAQVEGMVTGGSFELDDLNLNWTPRIKAPPRIVDLNLSATSVLRMRTVTLWVNVTDEYDPPEELTVTVEHQLEGDTYWEKDLIGPIELVDGVWKAEIIVIPSTELGTYHFRVNAFDKDDMTSEPFEPPITLEVLNNIPTAPEVAVGPEAPLTDARLSVTIVKSARDVEGNGLQYHFKWFRNGVEMTGLTGDSVDPSYTGRGQNWSVEVRAFDGNDEGPPATAWLVIGNSPTVVGVTLEAQTLEEDGDAVSLDLSGGFSDPDNEPLTFGVEEHPNHILIEVDEATGETTLTPSADWYGTEKVTFWATDGEFTANQTVTITVLPVNDAPRFSEIMGGPVPSGLLVLTVTQGDTLVITYSVTDIEDDPVLLSVDTDQVYLDEVKQELRFIAPGDMVGSVTFTLTVWDLITPGEKQSIDFEIVVENVNDPPGLPSIIAPPDGSRFKVNESFTLEGVCDDPDIKFGQVLEFSWTSDISGVLGDGTSLTLGLPDPGTHLITLTVTDGEFDRSVTITLIIEPLTVVEPPDDEPTDDEMDLRIPIILLIAIIGVGMAVGLSSEPGKYRLGLIFAPLVVKKDEVLDNKTRYALHGIIAERPGIHYSAIKEEFGLSNGVAAYHLEVLEREEFIRSVRDGRLKRFYSYDTKVPKNPKMTPEETRRAIVALVKERPGISQKRIINELGIERASVGYFLRELVKEGQLKADRQWRYTVYRVE